MANRPVELRFVAEIAQFLRDTKKVQVSTEDIADALVAVSNSGEDLERKLARAMRESERDVERLERAVKDIPKATDDMADKADKDFRRFGDDAGDAGKDAGRNLAQNLGEGLSSGDLSDTLQDTLGELVGSISGPVGAAVAAGAALALAVWNSFSAKSQKMKDQIEEAFNLTDLFTGQMDEIGRINAGLTELGGGNLTQGIQDAIKYADILGISFGEVADVVSGKLTPKTQETRDTIQQALEYADSQRSTIHDTTAETDALGDAAAQVLGTTKLQLEAQENANIATSNMRQYWLDNGEAINPLVTKMREVHDLVEDIPENKTIRIGLEYYATGPGASYIDPTRANYSPGHVAIANMYRRQGQAKAGSSS